MRVSPPSDPLTADEVYATLSTVKPDDSAVVMESTSTMAELEQWLPTTKSGSFFATGGGGIGWGVPGAVGVALGDRERGVKRTIGDGSFQYSIQAIWTAAQHKLPIVFAVLRNGAYAILKSFAELERTPGVPGLDLPGLDIASLAKGFGCHTAEVTSTDELADAFTTALQADGPTVIVFRPSPNSRISTEPIEFGGDRVLRSPSNQSALRRSPCPSTPAPRRNPP